MLLGAGAILAWAILQALDVRAGGHEVQTAARGVVPEVDADGAHVAQELGGRFLEGEEQAALAFFASGAHQMGGDAGLAGAGRAGAKDCGPFEVAPAKHLVQPLDAGGNAFAGSLVIEAQRRDGKDRDAGLVDEEGVLVATVGSTPILDDPQAASGDLVVDPVVEEDHAVGDVFFQPLTGEGADPLLARDDGGHPLILEPTEQAPQLRAQDGGVGQGAEERFDGVQRHTLGTYGIYG